MKQLTLVFIIVMCWELSVTEGAVFSENGLSGTKDNEVEAINFLRQYDSEAAVMCNRFMVASWNYNTNVTDHNRQIMLNQQLSWSQFHRLKWNEATDFAWKNFTTPAVRRMFSFVAILGRAALPEDELREFTKLIDDMKTTYSTAKICKYDPTRRRFDNGDYDFYSDYEEIEENEIKCIPSLSLEPHLSHIMATSRDPDELRYIWRAWRDATGKQIREKYVRFTELANRAAVLNGFEDAGQFWRSDYELFDLRGDLEDLWQQLRPLYEQLHAYVRSKLRAEYGEENVPSRGPIPAHLLGNMWAQSWTNVLDITVPYRGRTTIDVSDALRRSGYRPITLFQLAEEFFTSLGLERMPSFFWRNSLFEKPLDREVVCHASAWDFCNGFDYRIKQCTQITMEDMITAHHEMGHIQYDLQYRNQPFIFRDGANPGFHEAIGDVISLSVSSPRHLNAIGLLPAVDDSYETDINFLFSMALDKIAFLPFGYLVDLWRWEIFNGDISTSELNRRWWELRNSIQGIASPLPRDEEDFDAGAKFHVPANVPYVRYFVSFIIQFQFHAELCKAAGHTGSLHHCDIYRSREAGRLLSNVLSLGKSRPWSEALSVLTSGRTNKLDAGPILEYFAPLIAWLENQNRGEFIGWDESEALIEQQVRTSNSSIILGVILSFIGLILLVSLIICAISKCRKTGRSFNAATT